MHILFRRCIFVAALLSTMTRRITFLVLVLAVPATAQVLRDANCDGQVSEADRDAMVYGLFAGAPGACAAADVNRDGRRSAADLVAFSAGPHISYLGVASPAGQPARALGRLPNGAPVYFLSAGFGFLLVVEATASPSGAAVGTSTLDSAPGDPARRPDFQILVDRRLGDGSPAVCDEFGVPATDPPDFALAQSVADSINDLACRFDVTTRRNSVCTRDAFGRPDFVGSASRAQFCLAVNGAMAFPAGDTRIAMQVRDESGLVGPVQEMVLRVENGPFPATFTPLPPTPTRTATDTPRPTATASATRTVTATRTITPTRTFTRTATFTATFTASATAPPTATQSSSATPSLTATPSRTGTATHTGTPTRTGQRTATPTHSGTPTATGTHTRSPTVTDTPAASPTITHTPTRSGTPTRTATVTRTATATRTLPPSATITRTRTITPTPTPTVDDSGPQITFFGLTRADDMLLPSTGMQGDIRIFEPPFGFAFSLVVEAKPGRSGRSVGPNTLGEDGAPDLQIQVTRQLGNGSAEVCDDTPPLFGGVPAINPPNFTDDPVVIDRLNDLACRFVNGVGAKVGRSCDVLNACVLGLDGVFGCQSDGTLQFCGFIGAVLSFPSGDTLVTARVRDVLGNLGPPKQVIVRVP